jgi:hypothetical protein
MAANLDYSLLKDGAPKIYLEYDKNLFDGKAFVTIMAWDA